MIKRIGIAMALVAGTFLILCSYASTATIYDAGPLVFESTGQSMWDSGTAFRKEDSLFLGTQWTDKTATIGGIAGDANHQITPDIPAVTVPVWVPKPTWRNPFAGYWTDVQITPAIDAVTIDTRTGAELNVHSSGKVGLEFGYSIDSGSVDTRANFQAVAELPDSVKASEFFSLTTNSIFADGSLQTQSPKIEAYISAIMQLSGSIDAQACAVGSCTSSGSMALPTIDLDQRILSIDPNSLKVLDGIMPDGKAFAEVKIFNQSLTLEGGITTTVPPVPGFMLTGPGFTIGTLPSPAVTVELAEMTVYVPDIATTGTGSGENVTSNGRDDLLSLQLDLDGAATMFAGLPPTGMNFHLINAGSFQLSASLDLIDVKAGPVLGVTQDFEFTPTLMADIAFSNPVEISGLSGFHNNWSGLWSELPQFAINETTTFTPSFWLDASLTNDMGLDLGLVGTLDLLKLGATGSFGGVFDLDFNPFTLNDLLGIGNKLFETSKVGFSVYDTTFNLFGFDNIAGSPFTLYVAVPEPGTLGLMLVGLVALQLRRRQRAGIRKKGEHCA